MPQRITNIADNRASFIDFTTGVEATGWRTIHQDNPASAMKASANGAMFEGDSISWIITRPDRPRPR